MKTFELVIAILFSMLIWPEKTVRAAGDKTYSSDKPMTVSTNDQDSTGDKFSEEKCNEFGYMYFSRGEWQTAADFYNRAIQINPKVPKYFVNRALCLYKTGEYKKAIEECGKALDIEPHDVKAHFFMGSAYLKLGNLEKAVGHLQEAFNAAKEQRYCFGDDIAGELRLAWREMWRVKEDERIAAEEKRIEVAMFEEVKRRTTSQDGKGPASQRQSNTKGATNMNIDKSHKDSNILKTILPVEIRQRMIRREVPDYFFGRMNYKLLKDPVVTPGGTTYERKDIEDHLRLYGPFEPLLPQRDLKISQLIPNVAIKNALDAFREENSDWIDEFEQFISGSNEN